MKTGVKPIPEGCQQAIPSLVVRGGQRAIAFYQEAFGARVVACKLAPDGQRVIHGHLQIGSSALFVNDEFPEMGASRSPATAGCCTAGVYLYIEDVDATFQKAVAAGAKPLMPPMDMFWGDRFARIADPFGHEWALATHKEDLTPEEMAEREKAFNAQMAKQLAPA
jgi:PhnB protein